MSFPSDAPTEVSSDTMLAATPQASETNSLSVIADSDITTTKPEDLKEPCLAISLDTSSEQASIAADQTPKSADSSVNAPVPVGSNNATAVVEPDTVSGPDPEVERWEWTIFTLTLVRHGQSMGNVDYSLAYTAKDDEEDPLTETGKDQAKILGEKFKNVRIDGILASSYARATQTAQGIADEHCEPVIVDQCDWIIEREIGDEARRALRRQNSWDYNRLVNGKGSYPNFDRQHVPPGGESLDAVQRRAKRALVGINWMYGKKLGSERPANEDWWRSREHREGSQCKPDDIPEGVPHVVVVSHNIFLCEFYEMLSNWGREEHVTTSTDYKNTSWSRHVVKYGRPVGKINGRKPIVEFIDYKTCLLRDRD